MQEREKLTAECVDLNHQGQGVCKFDGFPIFVDYLLPGEKATIVINKLTKNYGFGTILELLEKSPSRTEPRCPAFGKCGGCEIMHLDYPGQLEYKKQMAISTFHKIGHLDNLPVAGILGMDDPYYYRNKVQIPFQQLNNKAVCGFFKRGSHDIYPLSECYIEPVLATAIAKFLRDLVNEYKIPAYNEKSRSGVIRHVLIRKNIVDEYMVVIITNTPTFANQDEIVRKLVSHFPNIKTVIHNFNPKDSNVVLGSKSRVLYGGGILNEKLLGLNFTVSHQSFFQTNFEQTEKLYKTVLKYADPKKNQTIVDGYCGVGTISLYLAGHCKKVIGIEVVEEAIKDAKGNAMINGIENAQFMVGKAEKEILKLEDVHIDTIVIDPPRKGCDPQLLAAIKERKLQRIVYVSCDVATLARDLEILVSDFDIKEITLVDMFPQICDVETVAWLELKS